MGNSEIADIIHRSRILPATTSTGFAAMVIRLGIRQTYVTGYLATLLAIFTAVKKDFFQDTYSQSLFFHGILTRKQKLVLS